MLLCGSCENPPTWIFLVVHLLCKQNVLELTYYLQSLSLFWSSGRKTQWMMNTKEMVYREKNYFENNLKIIFIIQRLFTNWLDKILFVYKYNLVFYQLESWQSLFIRYEKDALFFVRYSVYMLLGLEKHLFQGWTF